MLRPRGGAHPRYLKQILGSKALCPIKVHMPLPYRAFVRARKVKLRQAMSAPTLHHRTPEFESIFARARQGLKELIAMPEVLMLASSGSGAMEACVKTSCARKMLSVNSGKFGERFGKIAKAHNIAYTELVSEWDTPASLECVLEMLRADSEIDTFCIQICESAGGLRHDVEGIAHARAR